MITSDSFLAEDDGGAYTNNGLSSWNESLQYAPTPGYFGHDACSPSYLSTISDNPLPIDDVSSQPNIPQLKQLPLLQFGDWEEGRAYDEDPPSCIHYSIEWKVMLNNRTVAKDTEQDLVLAPRYHWRLFLQPKLKELLLRKYPHRAIESDDTSVVVSVTRHSQRDLTRRFDKTDIDWSVVEKQLLEWGDHFLAGKKLRLNISFNYVEQANNPASRRPTDKRGASSATQRMLQERELQLTTEEETTGQPAAWKLVYTLMRCPGPCEWGPHCWQDPYGKKHYKLYRDQLESLVKYVQSGGILQSHEDVPGMIREQIYKAERQRLDRPKTRNRSAADSACPPINITNVLPAQTPPTPSSSPPESVERGMSPIPQLPDLQIPGLLDVAVRDYSIWQQSRLGDEGLKAEVRKACDVALDDGLDLEQINEDKDPEYFRNRGVKWGIARRFVKDIRLWADKYKATVVG